MSDIMNEKPSSRRDTLILLGLGVIILLLIGLSIYQRRQILELREAINRGGGQDLGGGVIKGKAEKVDSGSILQGPEDSGVPTGPIKTDMDASDSKPTAVVKTTAVSEGVKESDLPSSKIRPRPSSKPDEPVITFPPVIPSIPLCPSCNNPDVNGYFNFSQFLTLNEKFGSVKVPFGEVEFRAWEAKPWSLEIYPRTYEIYTIIAEDSGKNKSSYSSLTIRTNDEKFQVPITSSTIRYTEPESSWEWNPRLMLGVSTGVSIPISYSWGPSLGITMGSYGQYKSSPNWYFGEISIGYEVQKQTPFLSLAPALYKISNHIPFTESLYIGPSVGIDIENNVLITAGFKLGI
jgi:hypothetical protein